MHCKRNDGLARLAVTFIRRSVGRLLLVLCVLAGTTSTTHAARPNLSTASRAAWSAAVRGIPLDRMDADGRNKALAVVRGTSVFRQLPRQVIDCDPRYYLFLVRHPEVIVSIWQKMDATDLTFQRKGPEQFSAQDGAGTAGNFEFLYGDHQTHVLYGQGSYSGPLTARPVHARCLLVLHANYIPDGDGRHYVANQLDIFIDIKNLGVELVAKTFQNMIGRATDQNFIETANFVTKLGRTTEKNGPGVQRLAQQLPGLQPDVRAAFAEQAGIVYRKARARQAAMQTGQNQTVQVLRAQDGE
ncbi:MAG: hypothetical protein GTO26_02300 [Planctomycetales bacterium]|nr:hypothetical protein [Planctomycetales bacterium]